MKRSLRVALLLTGAFLLFVTLSVSIQRWIVYPQFQALETQDVQRSTDRLTAALDRETESLLGFLADYAEWDDTYAFIDKPDPAYLLSNFSISGYQRDNFHMAWIIRPDGTVLYHGIYEADRDWLEEIPPDQADRILPGHPFLTPLDGKAISGFMPTAGGSALVAVHPIRKSDGSGSIRGILVMGRMLDESFARKLSDQLQLAVDLRKASAADGHLVPDRPAHRRLASGEIETQLLKNDWFGEPAVVLSLRTPPEITAVGRRALVQSGLAVIGQGLLFLLIGGLLAVRSYRRSHKMELARILEERTATLRETEQYLKSIMDTVPAGIIIVDKVDHKIRDVNPAALSMINARREEVVDQVCHTFICPAEKGKCPITDLGKVCDRAERVLLRRDGSSIPVLKTVVPTHLRGHDCLLECFVDIRDQKAAEEKIHQTIADMGRMNRAMIGREERVLELKHEVNLLLRELGRSTRYREETNTTGEEKP